MSPSGNDHASRRALPIGVFDSGLGGLTVVREIRRILPGERLLYLGDNARVPYGTRSPATIERYAGNCADFLVREGLKLLVVACNTVSAVALPFLRERVDVPVLGVIGAGARAACAATRTGRIGVIGTVGTVDSGAYTREIAAIDPGAVVHQRPAPLLVPLAEEGWLDGPVPRLAVERYVGPLAASGIDVLLLGCTHYPLLEGTIREVLSELGSAAAVVNSAKVMGREVADTVAAGGLENPDGVGALRCCVTDLPASFQAVAARFLGDPIGNVERVDIL
ncbi:MAG TPA: glutamate racemase [Polyangia bacterium]|nr:glutamate racemase [Polyangia bacterium]